MAQQPGLIGGMTVPSNMMNAQNLGQARLIYNTQPMLHSVSPPKQQQYIMQLQPNMQTQTQLQAQPRRPAQQLHPQMTQQQLHSALSQNMNALNQAYLASAQQQATSPQARIAPQQPSPPRAQAQIQPMHVPQQNQVTQQQQAEPAGPPQQQYPLLPDRRYMEISATRYNDAQRMIKVVSFNVMPKGADYKNRLPRHDALQGFRTRPNYYSWGRRGPLLIEEIKNGEPDIICLQGCDQFDFFQEKLAPRGFVGVYEKTQQPLQEKNVYFGDGLAIFWRTDKFELSGRDKSFLGDNRFISNIALLARLKRRSPFVNPLDMHFVSNNIEYESYLKYEGDDGNTEQFWCVLSTKYLYLFKDKQNYRRPVKYFDLDLFHQTKNENHYDGQYNANMGDHSNFSFTLYAKHKQQKQNKKFSTHDINVCLMWINKIKCAQIGIEIDVWNTQLIDGHSPKSEYRRVKQVEVLFECMARASATPHLKGKNIGARYNSYYARAAAAAAAAAATSSSSDDSKTAETKPDSKTKTGSQPEDETDSDDNDLSQLFKQMMEKRIAHQQHQKKLKEEDEKEKESPSAVANGTPTVKPVVIDPNKPSPASTKSAKEGEPETESGSPPPLQIPTQLHRPVILCADLSSSAHGDYRYSISPLSYTYLTMRSRTTLNNNNYNFCIQQLENDETCQINNRHAWFLQSAYALGMGNEPEFTSFNRYWPYEMNEEDHFVPFSVMAQTGRMHLDFAKSIEIAKCSDLILFSPQHFRVLKLLQPFDKQWILSKWNKTLPNIDYPSDHCMIGVEFELAISSPLLANNPMTDKDGSKRKASNHNTSTTMRSTPSPAALTPTVHTAPHTPTTPNTGNLHLAGNTNSATPTPTPSAGHLMHSALLANKSMATSALPTMQQQQQFSNNSNNQLHAQYTPTAHTPQMSQYYSPFANAASANTYNTNGAYQTKF